MEATPKSGNTQDPNDATEFSGEKNSNDDEPKNSHRTVSIPKRRTSSMIHTVTVKYPQWHNVLAGGIAGAGARLFTAPLDLIRIRAQLERKDVYPTPSILTRMINIYNAEGGVTALFRGNLAASYLWVGYTMVQFTAYGTIKETLEDCRDEIVARREGGRRTWRSASASASTSASASASTGNQQHQPPEESSFVAEQFSKLVSNPMAVAFVSGAIGGVCATMATYPFDICRTVFASKGALKTRPPNETPRATPATATATGTATPNNTTTFRPPSTIKECAVSMYRKDGIRGFYAGSAPAVVQIVPYMGLNFSIYDFLITQGEDGRSKSKSIGLSGYAGSISGAVSKIMVYPMDTIKKRMQIQSVFGASTSAPGVIYKGMWDCLATIIRMEGVRGLYRGLFPSVLKTTIGSGLSFTFYRTTKNVLESIHDYNF